MSGLNAGRMALVALVIGSSVMTSGCSSKSKAAAAQNPPPPSLSAPVRPEPSTTSEPSTPSQVVPADEYAFMKKNPDGTSSKPLPQVTPTSTDLVAANNMPSQAAPAPMASKPVTQPPVASAPGTGKSYTMQKGDTLYAVARKYNVPPKNLIAANNFKDPNNVMAGTRVNIP